MKTAYPELAPDRDAWILARRSRRNEGDSRRPYAFHLEEELSHERRVVNVATIFLTNRECPWRCLMCDLWKNTLEESVALGAIPEQIDFALAKLAAAEQVKLYNSGSFFDRAAIPIEDYAPIAERVRGFERVIVESHPSLINERMLRFRDLLQGELEVAMGLETANPQTLARLNKRMTVEQFAAAAEFLRKNGIGMRAFILVKPPFQTDAEALLWSTRSVEFAFDCGATAVSLIPTRFGNGALEALAMYGQFSPPTLDLFEAAVDEGMTLQQGRVFADLWDLEKLSRCATCFPQRLERLRLINLQQRIESRVPCDICGGARVLSPAATREHPSGGWKFRDAR